MSLAARVLFCSKYSDSNSGLWICYANLNTGSCAIAMPASVLLDLCFFVVVVVMALMLYSIIYIERIYCLFFILPKTGKERSKW